MALKANSSGSISKTNLERWVAQSVAGLYIVSTFGKQCSFEIVEGINDTSAQQQEQNIFDTEPCLSSGICPNI